MAKAPKPTRAERRAHRTTLGTAGVYGVEARDADADSWITSYVFFAESPDEARSRVRDAGFHKRAIRQERRPGQVPPQGLPEDLVPGDGHWYRSRLDDSGWTPWERLPEDYRQ